MQQLHAYWRMEYIAAPRYPERMERPFTELPALGDDRVALIVHRTPLSYLILNRFPYNPGHLLAVPFREVREIGELRADERADLFDTLLAGQRILTAALRPDAAPSASAGPSQPPTAAPPSRDRRVHRTRGRPLPSQLVSPPVALPGVSQDPPLSRLLPFQVILDPSRRRDPGPPGP